MTVDRVKHSCGIVRRVLHFTFSVRTHSHTFWYTRAHTHRKKRRQRSSAAAPFPSGRRRRCARLKTPPAGVRMHSFGRRCLYWLETNFASNCAIFPGQTRAECANRYRRKVSPLRLSDDDAKPEINKHHQILVAPSLAA